MVSRLIPLLVLGALSAGCDGSERSLAPLPDGPLPSRSEGHKLGGRIAFHSNRDGDFEIFVMDADGSGQTQLTHNSSHEFDPMWSPDGKRIGYSSIRDFSGTDDFEIWVMNADGSDPVQLTNNSANDFGPIWSPNGRRIAFASERDGVNDIYLMDNDGSDVRRLTTHLFAYGVTAWSPNGKQLAFLSYRDYVFPPPGETGDVELWVINANGTESVQITDNAVDDEGDHAGWSPNGKLFAFSSRRDGGDLDIFVMNADWTGVRQLTGIGGDAADDDDSFWSPNGKRIAFHSTRDGDEEIYIMNVDDGRVVAQLTFNTVFADGVPAWLAGRHGSGDHGDERE